MTPPKNLSAVSLTPMNNFLAVSLTPAINFRHFCYFWPVSTRPGKNLSTVSLTPVNNFLAVSLTPAINFRRFCYFWPVSTRPGKNVIGSVVFHHQPPKSATAAKIVIETAMIRRKSTSDTLIRGPGGCQNYFKPKGHYLVLADPEASIKMCGVFMDATIHGGSNDTIGGPGWLRRPEILPIYPFQLSSIFGSSPPPQRPCSCHQQ